MKKYILTSLMSLFLIVGTGLVLTATEKKECCSSSKTAEAVKTSSECSGSTTAAVQTASACGDKETKAESASSEVQMIQTSSVEGAAKSGCTGTAAAAACTGSAATKTAETKAGECTKAPAGVSGQRASREL